MKTYSLLHRTLSAILVATFTLVTSLQGRAWAEPAGSAAKAAGAAGAPAQQILESFHSDLATGRALFGIPIVVPPGRRGIQPSLTLNYASSAKNGPLGVGWGLELGCIERSTRMGNPSFDSQDTFVLKYAGVTADLVEISASEYRLKDEQLFAKIQFDGNSWTLTGKDGTKTTFGTTAQAQQTLSQGTLRWLLDKTQDIHGNNMTFSYQEEMGHLYPASIQYTAHPASGLPATHEIRFLWESRPDASWNDRFDDHIEMNLRLSRIEALTQGALVRRYDLAYTASPMSGRSLLSSVTTIGSDGQSSLPAIQLSYSGGPGKWFRSSDWKTLEGSLDLQFVDGNNQDVGMRLQDVTGDGKPDCLRGTETTLAAWRNTGSGWVREDQFAPPRPFKVTNSNGFPEDMGGRFADLNGDGRTDLVYAHMTRGAGAYLNTGTGWQEADQWNIRLGVIAMPNYFINGQGWDMGLRLVDLNGDGKSDLLQGWNASLHAYLNTGSGWVLDDRWVPPYPFVDSYGRDAGCRPVDLNGDGLTDLFYAGDNEKAVYLNTGRGWKREMAWNSGPFQGMYFADGPGKDQGWRLIDLNGDGLADLLRSQEESTPKVLLNTGTGWSEETSSPFLLEHPLVDKNGKNLGGGLVDLNADGMTDVVYATHADQKEFADLWSTAAQTTPATPPDLLTQVDNGIGGTTTLTYRPSSAYDNSQGDGVADLPFITQTVANRTLSDGMGWSATTEYSYSGGKFDAGERTFLGFAYGQVTDPVGSVAESWFLQDPHLKGRPYKQEAKDAAGALFSRIENSWACQNLFPSAPDHVHFCHLVETTSTLFDGDATFKQTKVRYSYDDYGNVTEQVSEGDTSVLGDERTTTTEYAYNVSSWLMGHPCHTVTTDSQGAKIAESWIRYDGAASHTTPPTLGLPTETESWLSTGPNPKAQATYDSYGNRLTSTNPLGQTTTTSYDAATQTFAVAVTNVLGHTLETRYDPGTGNVLSTTDPNGQVTRNTYDIFGRLIAVVGPEDTDQSPSVRYAYDLDSFPTRVTKETKASPSDYYTVHSFADGLGRTRQVRSPAEDPTQQIVTGTVEFDSRSKVRSKALSHFQATSSEYQAPLPDLPKALYDYDAMGRLTQTTYPDGSVASKQHSDWTVTVTDPNGNQTTRESDAYGRLIRVTEPGTVDHPAAVTTYGYDSAGRLTQVTDAAGNQTQMTYDSLGRKLTMQDPDMGLWSYAYDLAGNLVEQTDAKGQVLEFSYDGLNRLTSKRGRASAGATPITLATYHYDDLAKPNTLGRLSRVTDTSGSTEFFYDQLGREIKTIKTVEGGSFTVERQYDALNRLTELTYPDNLKVFYTYNPQGIEQITGSLDGGVTLFDLVGNADYNSAGETLALALGNGTTTDYTYDANTLRINSILTRNASNQILQDFEYGFDPAGNLTALTDRWNSASQTFQYDALNRLNLASGAYGGFGYRYNQVGNLMEKDNGVVMSYGLSDGSKPHAVTACALPDGSNVALTYDANGNLIQKANTQYRYDLQNRLAEVGEGLTPPAEEPPTPPGPDSVTYDLSPGWNTICVPFEGPVETIFAPLVMGSDYDTLLEYQSSQLTAQNHDLSQNNEVGQATGKIEQAAQMVNPGRTDKRFLVMPDSPGLSMGDVDFTVAAWVYFDTLPVDQEQAVLLGKGTDQTASGAEYYLRYNDANDLFEWVVGNNSNRTILHAYNFGAATAGNWIFVVAWHDAVNNEIGIQINGGPKDTTSRSGGSYDSDKNLVMGAQLSANFPFLNGRLDGVGIWKKVLSADERSLLYNNGAGCPYLGGVEGFETDTANRSSLSEQLKAYYRMNEASGTRVDDAEMLSDAWLTYAGDPLTNQFDSFQCKQGYKIHVVDPAGVQVTLTGILPAESSQRTLSVGWNLIPSPVLVETPAGQALGDLVKGTDYDELLWFNPVTKKYDAVSNCKPGQAYWIYCLQEKVWTIPLHGGGSGESAPPEEPAVSGVGTEFLYDGDGGRVKVMTPEGSTTFIGQMYETLSGGISRSHIFLGSTRIATLEQSPALVAKNSNHVASPGRTVLVRFFEGVEELFVGKAYADPLPVGIDLKFFHGDHLGSINVVTDLNGQQVELTEYAPFGGFARKEGDAGGSGSDPYFTGQKLDASTGLYYYNARYYDPELGRFTQPDTIVQKPFDPQTLNRYSYVRNSPLIYTDPSGHGFWSFFKKIAKGIGKIGRIVVSAIAAAVVFVATAPLGPQLQFAATAATFSFTNTFLNSAANGASFGKSLGAAATAGAISGTGAYFAWGAGGLAGATIGAAAGAAQGAATSAILGGSPGRGALSGAVGGAIMGGAAGLEVGFAGLLAASAGAGAASAAVANADPLEGAYLGALGAASFAIASASLQAAVDIFRAKGGEEAVAEAPKATFDPEGSKTHSGKTLRQRGIGGSEVQVKGALTTDHGRVLVGAVKSLVSLTLFGSATAFAYGNPVGTAAVGVASAIYTIRQGYLLYKEAVAHFENRADYLWGEAERQASLGP